MNSFMKGLLGAIVGTLVATGGAQWGQSFQTPIKWRTFDSGTTSRIQARSMRVLNNEAEFQTYWAQHTGSAADAPKGVEWGKELLIAIHSGVKTSGGYTVYVETMDRPTPNDIVVKFVEVKPPAGSVNITLMTSPWVLVRMERAGGNIRFQGREVTGRIIQSPPPQCGCKCACGRCGCS